MPEPIPRIEVPAVSDPSIQAAFQQLVHSVNESFARYGTERTSTPHDDLKLDTGLARTLGIDAEEKLSQIAVPSGRAVTCFGFATYRTTRDVSTPLSGVILRIREGDMTGRIIATARADVELLVFGAGAYRLPISTAGVTRRGVGKVTLTIEVSDPDGVGAAVIVPRAESWSLVTIALG